jgi:hypothetical protein
VVLWTEKRLNFGEFEVCYLVVGMDRIGRDHCMEFVQYRWCLGYIGNNCVADSLGE